MAVHPMSNKMDIDLIFKRGDASPLLLSIGYGNGHIVIQLKGTRAVDDILAFIASHRDERGAQWMEVGRFASCPVTLSLGNGQIEFVADSGVSVGSFGQSVGMYIPRELLDELVAGLTEAQRHLI